MASFRRKMYAVVDIILRVPPVFVVDTLFRNSNFEDIDLHFDDQEVFSNVTLPNDDVSYVESLSTNVVLKSFLTILGILSSFLVLMQRTSQLLTFYLWVISALSILLSYALNERHLEHISSGEMTLFQQMISSTYVFIGQITMGMVFYVTNAGTGVIRNTRSICFALILPSLIFFLPLIPLSVLKVLPLLSASYALLHMSLGLLLSAKAIILFMLRDMKRFIDIYRIHGLHAFIEHEWYRIGIPQVLRVFWLTRVAEQTVFLIVESSISYDGLFRIPVEKIAEIIKTLLTRGCDTYITVAGLTSVLSSICQGLGHAFHLFLMTEDREEERNMGTVSAILFMILALQTGLTGLTPEKRFARLYRNLCLLSTAVLHFIHSMVNPLLMSLSASRNMSLNRHVRALAVCAFLIVFPCFVLTYLWQTHSVSTWLLAISAFSIEVIIKVLTSLMVYTLFMIDAHRNNFWEKLDDYVYYIRSVGNTIEFLFGIFLFFNGAWILIFESGGTIRACMMVIHAYCNIWLQAKAGWQIFMKRRMAVYKISSLPEASPEKLQEHDDLCPICYQELVSGARITSCKHIFHSICLRKWLYVQDHCPLCHQKIYSADANGEICVNQMPNNENQENNYDHPHYE